MRLFFVISIVLKKNGKPASFFLLILFYQSVSSQSLQEKVVNFYNTKKTICYTFEEKRYNSALPVNPLISQGDVRCYREDDMVFYRGVQHYEPEILKDVKFETVKNKFYFGTNNFNENFFKDYKTLPENKRFYAYHNSPKDLLTPDTSLRSVFNDPKYLSGITTASEGLYRLELRDTNLRTLTFMGNSVGGSSKKIKVFYISKKDYSIVKYSLHTFQTIGDLESSDSLVYTYTYYELPFKKVKEEVDHFIPLGEKIKVPRPVVIDTFTVFPEFHLADTSGKIKGITSRYTLLDFWYRGCAPCLANMKELDKLEFKDLEILTINIYDKVDEDIRKIVAKHKYTFLFNGQALNKQLRLDSYPTMFLLDENRKILLKHVGYGDLSELRELMKKLGLNK